MCGTLLVLLLCTAFDVALTQNLSTNATHNSTLSVKRHFEIFPGVIGIAVLIGVLLVSAMIVNVIIILENRRIRVKCN